MNTRLLTPLRAWSALSTPLPLGLTTRRQRPRMGHREVTMIGDFRAPWNDLPDAEAQAIGNDGWFPSTADFFQLAVQSGQRDALIVDSPEAFLQGILDQPGGSIRRLNLVTHGSDRSIGFSGPVTESDHTTSVSFDEMLTEEKLDDLVRMARREKTATDGFGRTTTETLIDRHGKQVSIDALRNRFTSDAEIYVYACNAANDIWFLRKLAKALGVTVKAFDNELHYHYDLSATPDGLRVDRRSLTVAQERPGAADNRPSGPPVANFHQLEPRVIVRESDFDSALTNEVWTWMLFRPLH